MTLECVLQIDMWPLFNYRNMLCSRVCLSLLQKEIVGRVLKCAKR